MKRRNILILCMVSVCVIALSVILGCYLGITLPQERQMAEWRKAMQEYYDAKVESYEHENENYADFEVDAAFLGDSLTDGYDLSAYYPQYVTANRGIGGDTTFGLEKRLQVSVYDLKPKVVCMLIGGNNLSTMFDNYENLLIGLHENLPSTKVVILSLTSMGRQFANKNQLAAYNNVKIKALAEKYEFEFVDLFTPLFDVETNEILASYTTDGIHLTPAGYQVVTSLITPVLETLL